MEARLRRELWIWRAVWFGGLVAVVLVSLPLIRRSSAAARIVQAEDELQTMQRMLTAFHTRHGGWPRIQTPEQLILAFRGRMNSEGRLTRQEPSFLLGARLYFKDGKFEGPDSAFIDPWGTPYVYVFIYPLGENSESYLLASAGPDKRHSNSNFWYPSQNGTAPEDADNIWIRPGEPPQSGLGKLPGKP